MKINTRKSWLLAGLVISLSLFVFVKASTIANITNLKALMLDSGLYFGDSVDPTYVTMPTVTTADNYSVKIPFYNASAVSTARGSLIVTSNTATGLIYASMTTAIGTTTVLGVSDGVYASGVKGMMTITGYAACLTTGAVSLGDILVSSGTIGYMGTSAGVAGSAAAKALGTGASKGDLVPCIIGSGF